MSELTRYSISDNLKRIVSGERETVFRLLESRFCVEIQTRLPGLSIKPLKNADMEGVLSVLDQLKIAARNGEILTATQVERLLGPVESESSGSIPDTPIFRNRFGVAVSAKTPAQSELVKAVERNDVIFAKGLPQRLAAGLRPDQERTFRGGAFRNLIHLQLNVICLFQNSN